MIVADKPDKKCKLLNLCFIKGKTANPKVSPLEMHEKISMFDLLLLFERVNPGGESEVGHVWRGSAATGALLRRPARRSPARDIPAPLHSPA